MKPRKPSPSSRTSQPARADGWPDKAPPPQAQADNALGKRQHVIAVAEELTRAADAVHRRLAAELKKGALEQIDAQSLLEDEALLRERANSALLDAADYVLEDLPLTQEKLMQAIAKAQSRIEKLERIAMVVDLAADLSLLAGALLTAKTATFLAALKKLRADGGALDKIK
jgi:hypothetical protein